MEVSSETIGTVATAFAGLLTAVLVPITRSMVRKAHARVAAEVAARATERALEREDRQAERVSCEKRFTDLTAEIKAVRDSYNNSVVAALRESSVALAEAAAAQRESNLLMDRLCRRFEGLPCARDAAEKATTEKTPLHQKHA